MYASAGWFLENTWIIPAIMVGSFLLILAVGKRLPERVTSGIGVAAVAACTIFSFGVAAQWIDRVDNPAEGHGTEQEAAPGLAPAPGPEASAPGEHAMPGISTAAAAAEAEHETEPVVRSFTWFQSGNVEFQVGTLVDGLTAIMLIVVSVISLLVHIYSKEYLHGDVRFTHYYAFLSLFTASMLFYVMSSSTLQMLVGWELVGLCSFALIGHWWEEKKNSDAALKAFLTNRVGDVGLLLGVIVTFFAAGQTFNILEINGYALNDAANTTLLLVGALLLFAGVTSKSGQFPLHTWLPDAMAGPTPVSALIHAATMVVAGVFLIARLYPVFFEGLAISTSSIHYVAFIGGFTTLIGAALAFVQNDIKKVLAYSTISQLGYMVMALGVGAWTAGMFHLFTHAFFKACLFLCAGSVSHAAHHTFDMRQMGGLRKYMPITHGAFVLSGLALAGLFPFAGFWSKDEILAGAAAGQENAYYMMLGFGLVTAFLTAAYMGRSYFMTFWGEYRGHGTPHESPRVMTVPLIILAFCSVVLGLVNIPWDLGIIEGHRFEHYVQPTFLFPEIEVASFNPILAVLSVSLALVGIGLSYLYYQRDLGPHGLTQRNVVARKGYVFLENRYYLDHLYTGVVAGSVKGPIARGSDWFNQNVIDGIVNGVGKTSVVFAGLLYRNVDQKVVDGVVNGSGYVSEEAGEGMRQLIQTGRVQQYAAILFAAATVLAGVFVVVL
jgi:NADH-quinone oxidoreductase subunit L